MRTPPSTMTLLFVFLLLLAVGFAACGDDNGQEPKVTPCSVSADTLDFGVVKIGQIKFLPLSVGNPGTKTLTGSLPESSGPFAVTAGAGTFELAPGETHSATVRFSPTVEGDHSGTLTLGDTSCEVVCRGTGSLPSTGLKSFFIVARFADNEAATIGYVYLGGEPVSDAQVAMNGVAITYDADEELYRLQSLYVGAGDTLELRVSTSDDEKNYTAVMPQNLEILNPTLDESFSNGQDISVRWTETAPVTYYHLVFRGETGNLEVQEPSWNTVHLLESSATVPGNLDIEVYALSGVGDRVLNEEAFVEGTLDGFWAYSSDWVEVVIEP